MNGQTPPKRKRATRPDPHPTEVPRPKRTRSAAPRPATKAASDAPETAPVAPAPPSAPAPAQPPIAVFAPAPLPDRIGDVSPALTPRQLAFMAVVAAVILAVVRRLVGRGRGSRG